MDDDLDGVVFNIRACIVSSKGPVPLRNLARDYETLVGSQIPYRKFNFTTLESFLQSLPSLRICGSGSQAMVEAASSSASKHITDLISRQKSTAKKHSFAPPARRAHPPTSSLRGRGGSGHGRGSYLSRGAARGQSAAPRRYSPNSQNWNGISQNRSDDYEDRSNSAAHYRGNTAHVSQPLTVKVDADDNRQVSLGNTHSPDRPVPSQNETRPNKYELPPRLQKKMLQAQHDTDIPVFQPSPTSSVSPFSQNLDRSLYQSNPEPDSSSIISALGPSQLIAAGRAKQQAEQEKYRGNAETPLDSLLQLASKKTDDLVTDFKGLSHTDSLNGFNQFQIPEVPRVVRVPEPDDHNIQNNVKLLKQYCIDREWPNPDYTLFHRKSTDVRHLLFGATVKMYWLGQNQSKFSSYPDESESADVAKGYAARKALKHLLKMEQQVISDKTVISTEKSIICDRISNIVAGVFNGMFARTVEERYMELWQERLPPDWTDTLSCCPTVAVEATVNSVIIVPRDPAVLEPPLLSEQTCAPAQLSLEDLDTGEDNFLDVYITHATSSSNVWFRIIGEEYSEKYEDLLTNMDLYYKGVGAQDLTLVVEKGQYFAVCAVDTWTRVCVYDVDVASRRVSAWLIDHGDNDTFPFSSLYRLTPEFCQLPSQAIRCSLDGLEHFNDDKVACEIISNSDFLIGKTLIAKVTSKEVAFLKVMFYDTSGEDDILVNDLIREAIIYSKADPVLPTEGCATEVVIGDVSKRGEVYIQIPGAAYDHIAEIVDSLAPEEISRHKLTSFRHIVLNKMYLAKYSKDDTWYRAVVTTTPSVQQNKIAVRFVDFGNSETVSITDIADMEKLPSVLSKLPPQAVKVGLHNLPVETMTNADVAKLHSLLMDEEKVVLIKTVSLKADPPVVEIFTKTEDDNAALVSVNFTIELQRKLNGTEENKNTFNSASTKKNLNGFSDNQFALRPPDFKENFHGVLVVLAAHPGNFIFQPINYGKDLKTLRGQMQAYYDAASLPEVPKSRVVKGNLFAAHYTDNTWYRVVVTDSIMGCHVPVRLCDYGDITCVNLSSLRELEATFLKYPFMAVKGKLAGIVPSHKDWSVEDCIRFQSLVVDKMLAALIVDIQENIVDPMEMVVTLKMVDTSSDRDEDISDILIKENRAVRDK